MFMIDKNIVQIYFSHLYCKFVTQFVIFHVNFLRVKHTIISHDIDEKCNVLSSVTHTWNATMSAENSK